MPKKYLRFSVLLVLISFCLALKKGDQVELMAFLNARTSAQFTGAYSNIKIQLPKGTRGEVRETKKMPSGNFGIQLRLLDGQHAGETYWLYYDLKRPGMKIYNQESNEVKPDDIVKVIPILKKAVLLKNQEALRDPEESVVIDTVKNAQVILEQKKDLVITPIVVDCAPQVVTESNNIIEEEYNESVVVAPYRALALPSPYHQYCQTVQSGWDQCRNTNSKIIEGFKIRNNGPNNIVKTHEYYMNREMSFEFDDHAGSDMKLVVTDSADDKTSHTTYSIMLFFPRSVLPAVKKIGEELEVTLPTKEIVRYNAKTHEIIGGVFTEGAMESDPKNNNKAKPANIKYNGAGVMIRADKSGDLPYGDIELRNGTMAPSTSIATVSKKGFKDCKIPSKDIWYTDKKDGGVYILASLATDKGLDEFIKKQCAFSLY